MKRVAWRPLSTVCKKLNTLRNIRSCYIVSPIGPSSSVLFLRHCLATVLQGFCCTSFCFHGCFCFLLRCAPFAWGRRAILNASPPPSVWSGGGYLATLRCYHLILLQIRWEDEGEHFLLFQCLLMGYLSHFRLWQTGHQGLMAVWSYIWCTISISYIWCTRKLGYTVSWKSTYKGTFCVLIWFSSEDLSSWNFSQSSYYYYY